MRRLAWLLDKATDLAVAVVAGIVLYLILGGYISQPLSEIYPSLPSILIVSLVLAILSSMGYRFYKSVRFHRFVERSAVNIGNFLIKWNELKDYYEKARSSMSNDDIGNFENVRLELLYGYPKISSAVKVMRYSVYDRIQGIAVENYDVIGNLLGASPFAKDRMQTIFATGDYRQQWDKGRTVLVGALGFFDCHRETSLHTIYWNMRLVPFPKELKQKEAKEQNLKSA